MKLGDGLFLLFCGLLFVGAVGSLAGDPNVQQLFSGVAPVVDGGGNLRGSPGDTAPVVVVIEPTVVPLPVHPTVAPQPTTAPVVPTWVAPTVYRYNNDDGGWAGPAYGEGGSGYSGDTSTVAALPVGSPWDGFPMVVVCALGGTAILAGLILLAVYVHRYVTITRMQAAVLQTAVMSAGPPAADGTVPGPEVENAAAFTRTGCAEDEADGEGAKFEAIGLDEFLQPAVAEVSIAP